LATAWSKAFTRVRPASTHKTIISKKNGISFRIIFSLFFFSL
jgi:hypothetical protein